MVRNLAFTSCFALAILASNSTSFAHEADEVFERCNQRLIEITRKCVNESKGTFERCAPRIRHLLEHGRVDEAHALARECIQHIEQQVQRCDAAIDELCRTCIRRLLELEAPELAERFRNRCVKSKRTIHHAGRRAIEAIRNLFD